MVNIINHVERKVKSTIKKFDLFTKHDKILVAVSGGKDSTTALYIMQKLGYRVEAITINALIGNYSKQNLKNIQSFCKMHGINLHIISFRNEFGYSLCYIRSILKSRGIKLKSCTLCGILKRYLLNKTVRRLRATKLVTGHNLDDEAQSFIMNLLRGNLELSARLGPKTGLIANNKFVTRVKPLYLCFESEIEAYSKKMNFPVYYGRCPCSVDAYRRKIRNYLNEYETQNTGTKPKIINYFLKLSPKLKQYYKTEKQQYYCDVCGEPSKKKICRSCEIIGLLR
jgi:uncharacterized protein (TIGR00269 family)